jgi:subtilisin family serine protease
LVYDTSFVSKIELDSMDKAEWYRKDIILDSLSGISLNRALDFLALSEKSTNIIVAVLDSELDTNHKNFKSQIWKNNKEIPDNHIDDDKNGFIDDINGWNFLGALNQNYSIYSSTESVRIIQKFNDEFEGKNINEIDSLRLEDFLLYNRAKKSYSADLELKKSDQDYGNFLFNGYPAAKNALKKIYPKENYSINELDSIYKLYKTSDSSLAKHAYFISDFIKYDLSEEWIRDYKLKADSSLSYTFNLDLDDRLKRDRYPENLDFKSYGSPFLNKKLDDYKHATEVAGVIASFAYNIKIMSLAISPYGHEHDKDIALAIRYAVDNGAHIINMSFGKEFSLHKEWVFDAIRYAESKNVLIISSAGNSAYNLNDYNDYYPNDNIINEKEVTDNFLLVGSSSHNVDRSLFSYFSNYGSEDVDLFAPGEKIYTTLPNDKYTFDSGTSLAAAITSGVAALIRSYYPDLTASQVKHILMDSGIEYTLEVSTPTKEDPEKTTPFNQLSKSGKVLNAYNALIMAERVSKE